MYSKAPLDSSADLPVPTEPTTKYKQKTLQAVISKLGLDIIPVIAGILIALFINKWQENYHDRKLLESTLQSLSNEFNRNAANIHKFLPRQSQFLDTLRRYSNEETYSVWDIATKASGMGTADIYTTVTYSPAMFKQGREGWEYRRTMELWLISYMGNEKELLQLYQNFEKIVRNKQYRPDS